MSVRRSRHNSSWANYAARPLHEYDMLLYSSTLQSCKHIGTMLMQWVRKFPFFCSDREYVIGRRIWDAGRVFYCITKFQGVQYLSLPRQSKPRCLRYRNQSMCSVCVCKGRKSGSISLIGLSDSKEGEEEEESDSEFMEIEIDDSKLEKFTIYRGKHLS